MGEPIHTCTDKSQFLNCVKKEVGGQSVSPSAGFNLPGTEAGDNAAQFYADMYVEGEKKGGVKGFFLQAGGYAGGLFACLWTPETASTTAFTLATAGLGVLANAGRLGVASLPVTRTLQVAGSFQGGLSAGQALTGEDLSGNKLSTGERVLHGAAGAVTFLTLTGLPNSSLFGRANFRPPGAGPGFFNKGPVRMGWSWRGQSLPGGGRNYFALHGGGKFQGVSQGPHWHLYLNRFWPSGPAAAPAWATAVVRGGQIFTVVSSGMYGYEIADTYFNNE